MFKGLSGLSKTSNCKPGQTIGAQPKWRLGRIKGEKVVSGDLLPSSFFFFWLFLLSLRFGISRVFFSAECSLEIKKKDLSSCCSIYFSFQFYFLLYLSFLPFLVFSETVSSPPVQSLYRRLPDPPSSFLLLLLFFLFPRVRSSPPVTLSFN